MIKGKISIKHVLMLALAIIFCLPSCGQNVYYISNSGNSQNSGLSPDKPWSYLKEMQPGNTYLFKSGETFYCNINSVENQGEKKIKLGSYGKGRKPVLTTYKHVRKEFWEPVVDNLWRVKLSDAKTFYGFTDPWNLNIGFLKVGDKIRGSRKSDRSLLKEQWDFFADKEFLYVYSNANPGLNDVKVAANYCLIRLSNGMEIYNLRLEGTGGHAIQGSVVNNVKIINVEIADIGGSYLDGYAGGDVRYGNGIELWNGASSCIIKNCNISNVFDAAITMQGKGEDTYFQDVTIENNFCYRNGQSFEFWISGYKSGFKNCKFMNNACYDAGYGWSYEVRPDRKTAVHVLNYVYEVNSNDLIISNNIFSGAKGGYMYVSANFRNHQKFISELNKIYLDEKQLIDAMNSKLKIEDSKLFIEQTGLERKSKFNVIRKR